ncbi:Werner syndrome-like exonuclease [Rhynchospora pubera]|uniref:Werner syndrome-like exonuclease n=1 Tax=Rhynchospora pubera TaxID=906938 RepID=A0AAV8DYN9_9POAL|nr:Werner syndrome-like exonuclease [Rhynchospora pubera]KAJ4771362.1 Werner syndrome-like exonuclease [Rhynchospora pubera]
MGIFYDHTDSTYVIDYDAIDEVVKTTVTASGEVAADWIDEILRIHRRRLNHLIVGLDIEWCPHGWHGTTGENSAALLQLCVGRRCLVFQLIHCDYIPDELSDFLLDDRFRFVGVGIHADLQKLDDDYDLEVENAVDLRYLAAENLVREFMGAHIVKPRNVRLSDWSRRALTQEQIEYAAFDAFTSFEIGRRLVVGEY